MCNAVTFYFGLCGHFYRHDLERCESALEPHHPAPLPCKNDLDIECGDCAKKSAEEKDSDWNRWVVFQRKDAAWQVYEEQLQERLHEAIELRNQQAWNANRGIDISLSPKEPSEPGRVCLVCKNEILAGELCVEHVHLGGKTL